MMSKRPAGRAFREGEPVVLAEGTYQGTPGVFIRLKEDVKWADIAERDGSVRSHPVAWLDHSTSPAGSSVEPPPAAANDRIENPRQARMNGSANEELEAWEDEGGAARGPAASLRPR